MQDRVKIQKSIREIRFGSQRCIRAEDVTDEEKPEDYAVVSEVYDSEEDDSNHEISKKGKKDGFKVEDEDKWEGLFLPSAVFASASTVFVLVPSFMIASEN